MIKLTIDGTELQVSEGTTLLDAARTAEIYVPHLCSHPDLPAVEPEKLEASEQVFHGSEAKRSAPGEHRFEGCQLCLVKVEGRPEPVRSCVTVVEDGMVVSTTSEEITTRRRAGMKKLFTTHPHACVQCAQRAGCALEPCSTNVAKEERCCPIFGVCELRKVAEFVGIPDDTARYHPSNMPIIEDEPLFLRDHNLCIGCLRCVRMCRDLRKVDAYGFVFNDQGDPVVGTKAPTMKESGCHFCLSCVDVCPTGSLRMKFEDPRVDGERLVTCVNACPARIDIPRYLREIRRGEFARAEAVVREAAPLPRTLGQTCFHPCEDECIRGELVDAIAICSLKRAAVEHADEPLWKSYLETRPATGKTVSIVGAGPAGLTAAWYLRLLGHDVVVFDSLPRPGGWMRNGIPAYRLSTEALDADVADIEGLGVKLKMATEVGRDVTFDELRSSFDAVFIAAGARMEKRLPCDGVELPGVESGLALLRSVKVDGDRSLEGETVVVIGGGNVAIDVARTAARLKPAEVHLYCLEEREEMPAHSWETKEAEGEGIIVHPGWGPKLMTGDGKVERIDFRKCVAVFDDEGRFAPSFDEEVTTSQEAARVLIAIGQEPALSLLGDETVRLSGAGFIESDPDSMQTSIDGVFAGGEIVLGPSSIVDAIDQGKKAATGIDCYLGGDGNLSFALLDETEPDHDLNKRDGFFDLPRVPLERLAPAKAVGCFELVEAGYSTDDATREAERCLRCDLRLLIRAPLSPPESWLEFSQNVIDGVPETSGVYQLLDENKHVYAIKGVDNLKEALTEILETSSAKFFLFDEDPMYSKRESELIQEYLRIHGCMPPGEGEDDLDDLF